MTSRGRNDAKLGHEVETIRADPVLDELPSLDAQEVVPTKADRRAGRRRGTRDAAPVGASSRPASRHHRAIDDWAHLYREPQVRKWPPPHADQLGQPRRTAKLCRIEGAGSPNLVDDETGRNDLLGQRKISVPHFQPLTVELLGRHARHSASSSIAATRRGRDYIVSCSRRSKVRRYPGREHA